MCSSSELLAEEMDHLGKVLKYNNYPKWMIDQHGRNSSEGRLIDPETGNGVKKSVFISAPYFLGLSESFKQLFKYTPVQVCFKGQNTIKSIVRYNLTLHCSVTPFVIRQPIHKPRLLERVYKAMHTSH